MPNTDASITEFFQQVTKRSNYDLILKIEDALPDPKRWSTITLLSKDLEKDADLIHGLVLHECEHRLSYPGGEDKLLTWTYAAWAGRYPEPLNLVSLVSDTFVHKELLRTYPDLYRPFLESVIAGLESSGYKSSVFTEIFRAVALDSGTHLSDLASKVYHVIFDSGLEYEVRVQHVAGLLDNMSATSEDCGEVRGDRAISEAGSSHLVSTDALESALRSLLGRDVPIKDIRSFVAYAHIYLALSIEPPGLVGRLDSFLKQRVHYLRQLSNLKGMMAPKQILGLRELLEEFKEEMQAKGTSNLTAEELAECEKHIWEVWGSVEGERMRLTGKEVKKLIQMLVGLRMASRGVKLYLDVSEKLRGTRTSFNPPPTIWNIGDPVQELSIADTYRTFGTFVPGVLAVKRRELVLGKHASNMAIVIDASGSMASGGKIYYGQEIAFFLIEAAKRKKDTVSLIPFSSEVDPNTIRIASTHYDLIQDLVAAIEPLGQSTIAQALTLSLLSACEIGRQSTFVITDGGIQDHQAIGGVLNELLNYGNLFTYIVGERLDQLNPEVRDMFRGRVYECNVYKPFSDEGVLEYLRL